MGTGVLWIQKDNSAFLNVSIRAGSPVASLCWNVWFVYEPEYSPLGCYSVTNLTFTFTVRISCHLIKYDQGIYDPRPFGIKSMDIIYDVVFSSLLPSVWQLGGFH